eukprot:gene34365-41597_t
MDIRPSLDDVERISRGQAAKKRGTGSRAVPHRLNTMERKEWELAKKRRFVQLRGTGYRRERGDSPLANIYRNFCDAVAVPCISLSRALGIDASVDKVTVDFSPLRSMEIQDVVSECIAQTNQYTSIISVESFTNNTSADTVSLGAMLLEEPIWRLPVFPVVVGFTSRSEAKAYAQHIACTYAKGQVNTKNDADDEDFNESGDEEDEEDEEENKNTP